MSIYKGNSLVAGGSQVLPLLTFIWSDCIKNHPSWLRADTFSWQSGSVYQAVYAHLTADITGKTLQSETISGTTIQFYLADDGHKICPASEESNVTAIYNATGVAWYYIIDTTNQRFKLPRINPDSEELAYQISAFGDGDYLRFMSSDGSYKGSLINSHSESLGSGTGWLRTYNTGGALVNLGNMKLSDVKGQSGIKVEKDTIFSGKKYLYFYVGNFTQTALENTAGLNASLFNGKADLDLSNITASAMSMLFTAMLPDYSAGVSMAANVTHTATENGWVYFYQFSAGDRYFYIDGVQFHLGAGNGSPYYSGNCVIVPISKGQTFMGNNEITFFPCRN